MSEELLPILVPAAIGVIAAGGYALQRWFGGPTERAIRKGPRRAIKGFPEGEVGAIRGVIEAFEGKSVKAPLSDRNCVAYSVRVEEYKHQGQRGSWEAIVQDFDAVNFLVNDGTGRALVRAAGSWPSPLMDEVGGSGVLSSAGPALDAFLQAHGQSSTGLVFNKRLRAHEGVLTVGMRVAVRGIARRSQELIDGANPGGYRDGPGSLVIECLDDGTLPMSNAPPALR